LQQRRRHRDLPHTHEAAQAQLHADQEQEHEHAEIGQRGHQVAFGHQTEAGRTENHSGKDVTDDRRLLEPRHDEAAQKRRQNDEREAGEVELRQHDGPSLSYRSFAVR
jgi:protein subunit release factor A